MRRAISCICLNGPDRSSQSLGASEHFSSQTKQLRMAQHWAGVNWPNTPLKIISVRSNSSELLNSHPTLPFNSITSALEQKPNRRSTLLRHFNSSSCKTDFASDNFCLATASSSSQMTFFSYLEYSSLKDGSSCMGCSYIFFSRCSIFLTTSRNSGSLIFMSLTGLSKGGPGLSNRFLTSFKAFSMPFRLSFDRRSWGQYSRTDEMWVINVEQTATTSTSPACPSGQGFGIESLLFSSLVGRMLRSMSTWTLVEECKGLDLPFLSAATFLKLTIIPQSYSASSVFILTSRPGCKNGIRYCDLVIYLLKVTANASSSLRMR
uniref:Uncharacterized protein n=1 Tax=Photinus pyralis TaxID=7054 RepID=A0A1Y1N5V7_PHOPY